MSLVQCCTLIVKIAPPYITGWSPLMRTINILKLKLKNWTCPVHDPFHTICNNRIWWLCLVPTSTTRFPSDFGVQIMAIHIFNRVMEYMHFLLTMTSNSQHIKTQDIPSQILKTILDCIPQLSFRPQYAWVPSHLYFALITNFSGQLAELIWLYPIRCPYMRPWIYNQFKLNQFQLG